MLINKYNWREARFLFKPDGDDAASETPPVTDPPADGDTPAEEPFDKERAMDTIRKLRGFEKSAKELQKQLDALSTAEKERQEKELSEVQKAEKRAQEAQDAKEAIEQRFRTNAIQNAVRLAATQAGFIDAEDAVLHLSTDSTIDLDENDKVVGVESAIKALAKAKPHLLKPTKPAPPNIDSAPGGTNLPKKTVTPIYDPKRHF